MTGDDEGLRPAKHGSHPLMVAVEFPVNEMTAGNGAVPFRSVDLRRIPANAVGFAVEDGKPGNPVCI